MADDRYVLQTNAGGSVVGSLRSGLLKLGPSVIEKTKYLFVARKKGLNAAPSGPVRPARLGAASMGLRRRWAGAVLLCACRAAAEEQGLRRAGKERVLGVGLGVFLLSFFFIAMCALCWAGALLPQERGEQWIFNVVGTLGFGVVACVLFLADERPEYASEERAEREHDDNLIGLIVVAGLLACAAAFGLGAVLCYHVCAPVEAPLVQKRPAGDRQGLFDASGQCVASRPAFTA